MNRQSDWQVSFDFFDHKPIVVEPQQAQLTSDAGLLADPAVGRTTRGLTAQFAAALNDPRDPDSSTHSFLQMVRMRVYGILADYPDQNDHDVLRHDPLFKLLAGRSPEGRELASQPTLSRFENAVDVRSLRRLEDVFIDQFIASFATPPRHLTFDIDVFDDPTHGQQQLTFFHGYYDQYQYLPRVITCKENDLVAMVCLLFGTAHAALGIEDDLPYLDAQQTQLVLANWNSHLFHTTSCVCFDSRQCPQRRNRTALWRPFVGRSAGEAAQTRLAIRPHRCPPKAVWNE